MTKCIIRTEKAGVHYGTVVSRKGSEIDLIDSRRLWYWRGANCLSQLAKDGTKDQSACKFSVSLDSITILGVIEVIPCTEIAIKSIEGVPMWRC